MRQLIAIIDVYADCTWMIYFATTRVLLELSLPCISHLLDSS